MAAPAASPITPATTRFIGSSLRSCVAPMASVDEASQGGARRYRSQTLSVAHRRYGSQSMRSFTVAERRARLARRHFLEPVRRPRSTTLTGTLVGLHATDPATPYLSLWARLPGFSRRPISTPRCTSAARVVKHLAMRRTLWVVRAEDLPLIQRGCQRPGRRQRTPPAGRRRAEGRRGRRRRGVAGRGVRGGAGAPRRTRPGQRRRICARRCPS